ncbi:alpha/beta fold hydrolase [Streptomyces sp. NPDC059740]|uniref:alpha/beta fold hydrolase n=1 Tax=Streptomyces sp. NPDC059740 TaxID=3346926 RepID=UPI003663F8F5
MSSTDESPDARALMPVPPAGRASRVGAGERVRTVTLPGLTLSVRTRAEQRPGLPTALYVHGLGGSSQNWSDLMPRLADRVNGVALDLPGFGDSPPPDDGNYSVPGHARAVIRYLEACHEGPVHLLGNSLGGAVATTVAAARPDLVRTLTLISPAMPEVPPQLSAMPTALLALPGVTRLFRHLTRDWTAERRTREVLGLCYGDPGRVSPDSFAAATEEYARRLELPYFWDSMERSARGIVNAYTLGGQYNLWRQAERVLAPTLLVYGGRDRLVSFRMARRAAEAFHGSRMLTLPDAGHVAMMEYPEAVAGAVGELLDSVADDRPAGDGRHRAPTGRGSTDLQTGRS